MVIIIFLLLSSLQVFSSPLKPLSNYEQRQRLVELSHRPWTGVIKEKAGKSGLGCALSELTIPVLSRTDESWEFKFKLLMPQTDKKVPHVMVIPTIEGVTPLEPAVAWQLCQAGYAVSVIDANDTTYPATFPSWGHEDMVLRRTIITLRTIMDWIQNDERFVRNQIGLYGHSLGGITASLMAGVEISRLKAVIIGVGGGNMPGILTDSIYPRVAALRWLRYQSTGNYSAEDHEKILRETFKYDPLYFANRVKTDRLYKIMARFDLSVPYKYQKQTHEAFGNPQHHTMWGAHIDGLVRMSTIDFDKIQEFLDSKLK